MTGGAFGSWRDLPPIDTGGDPSSARADWVAAFGRHLYGPVPAAPDGLEIDRLPCGPAERLTLRLCGASFDALLWRPPGRMGRVPVIAGLDFVGPYGLPGVPFPRDPEAIICAPRPFGGEGHRLTEAMRGRTGHRWPVEAIHRAGFALLLSCYGSWVPDDPDLWRERGLRPILGPAHGAISLWAWALMRLVDVAEGLDELGPAFLAGHSRLGKAALWAGANDPRVAGVFANASGCAGAAPAAHGAGETLADLTARYPHWLRDGAVLPDGLDQHHLLAAIAPRPLVVTGARGDIWADPVGSYRALCAASGLPGWPEAREMWSDGGVVRRGAMCHGLRDGGHDLTPQDWGVALPVLSETFS